MARTRLATALALAVACTALTGAAFAGPPDDPGKSENAPGQEKKAEAPAPAPAATPPASPGKSESAPGKTKTSKAATPSKGKSASAKGKGKSEVKVQQNEGKSADAHHHVIVCHATGSESNPFVVINIPMTAWKAAHDVHQDDRDFILKDPASRQGTKDGFTKEDCEAQGGVAPEVKTEEKKEEGCPPVTTVTKTTTETKVEHKAGKKGKIVEISPSDKSAHVRKHGEKKTTVVKTETKVVGQGECAAVVQAQGAPTPTVAPTQPPAEAAQAPAQAQAAQAQVTQQAPAGEVAGVQARIVKPKAKARGGVLGALGAVAGEELPFTGLPLWIAALIGFGLVGAGFGARKAMR
jgi:hypothetical protein